MKNYEKYADEIKGYDGFNFCRDFVKPRILKPRDCANTSCDQCKMLQTIWLMEDYEEPKVDWGKVEVDTPILVKSSEDGNIYAWCNGRTSWNETSIYAWKYAKLAESEESK